MIWSNAILNYSVITIGLMGNHYNAEAEDSNTPLMHMGPEI